MSKNPQISLITVCFNSQDTIEQTILSVLKQDFLDIEYIIIDGKSTDATLHIINSYKNIFQTKNITLKLVSEKDDGIYDAMNKGIKLATGDIIGFLNADDFFTSNQSLSSIIKAFKITSSDCVFGNIYYVNQHNKIIRNWISSSYKTYSFYFGWHPAHPTFYVKNHIYQKYGNFDLDFKIAADYEIMLRFLQKYKISSTYIPQHLVSMHTGGTSNSSIKNILQANIECYKAWQKNQLCNFPLFIIFKPLRKLKNFLRNKND